MGVAGQGRIGFDMHQFHGGLCAQRIKVIEVGDARQDHHRDSDLCIAARARWSIKSERVFGR